jgi:hypothetical protein
MLPLIEQEEDMSSNMLKIALWSLMLAAATPSAAQSPVDAAALKGMQCGGQYECVEDRPLTPAEARASLGYPHAAESQQPSRQDTATVAATKPTITK